MASEVIGGCGAVYGFGIEITYGGTVVEGGGKAVVDCATGRLTHMVGPGT